MFHYCYKTTVIDSNGKERFYLGKHSTKKLDDGYLGSGLILQRILKSSKEYEIKKEIIEFFDTSEDAFEFEELIISEAIEKYGKGKICLNVKPGGKGGWIHKSGSEHPCFGKPRSEKVKSKISKSLKLNHPLKGVTGKDHPNYGLKWSLEQRLNISEQRKGPNNPNYGKTGAAHHCFGRTRKTTDKLFKGWYVTPSGKFTTSSAAGLKENVSGTTIRKWCKNLKPGYFFIPKDK
ncbi:MULTISPECIES: NUMOD3 domain-containing DNA-binding protein [Enterobacter cloacae complex]|uniref:NUMOD3 domain-containing DNA-binding protein n=1 Tax=Enterobacter cloacae complex TaxID=354276 RepID=UPI000907F245|nr:MULTISPECIES: NUMOD3 domain-containing DNA-binding protein [Enterobacter cloacae complex]MCY0805997.1 NUMOD3 domain-containing DNA-binding protein [Enterobacter cloacae complex sp. 2022EL-00747]